MKREESAAKIAALFAAASNANQPLDPLFRDLMPALCEALLCDRCFLQLRDPETQTGCIAYCWGNSPRWADLTEADWREEGDIASLDPLMAIAFRSPESVFVEDIETAGPDIVNLEYERSDFGHRALIHTPLYDRGKLYGILEPCVFETPRIWSEGDRRLIAQVQAQLTPLVAQFVRNR